MKTTLESPKKTPWGSWRRPVAALILSLVLFVAAASLLGGPVGEAANKVMGALVGVYLVWFLVYRARAGSS